MFLCDWSHSFKGRFLKGFLQNWSDFLRLGSNDMIQVEALKADINSLVIIFFRERMKVTTYS